MKCHVFGQCQDVAADDVEEWIQRCGHETVEENEFAAFEIS